MHERADLVTLISRFRCHRALTTYKRCLQPFIHLHMQPGKVFLKWQDSIATTDWLLA